jgi:hypothetical protein
MALDVLLGKPVDMPENVGFRPDETHAPDAPAGEEPMPERELMKLLMMIKRRSSRVDLFSGAGGSGRIVTEQSLSGE